MKILRASETHFDAWLTLRKLLWPDAEETHEREMHDIISSDNQAAFLMYNPDNEPIGFIEGALYLHSPQKYGYIEGWFMLPQYRGRGYGGQLLGFLEEWFLHHAIALSLSDTIPREYPLSPRAHAKYGYRELSTLKIYIKELASEEKRKTQNQHVE